jgi:hypothetical protein
VLNHQIVAEKKAFEKVVGEAVENYRKNMNGTILAKT